MDACDLKEKPKDKSGALSCCKNNIFDNTENNIVYGKKKSESKYDEEKPTMNEATLGIP